MNEDFKTVSTLIGGAVQVGGSTRADVLLGSYDVVTLDHEDGTLEFTEEQAAELVGALSIQLVENRKRRALTVFSARGGRKRDACDRAYLANTPCPKGNGCRYPL